MLVRGNEDDLGTRFGFELQDRSEAAAARHLDVEDDEIGAEFADARVRLLAVARLVQS